MKLTTRVVTIIVTTVTMIIGIIVLFLLLRFDKQIQENFLFTARAIYKNVLLTRQWVSDHNGVFVSKTPQIKSNPYLKHPDLITREGDTLTLKNPALVTRELSEMSKRYGSDFSFHMASLKYLNPLNRPDEFEERALIFFNDSIPDKGIKEFYKIERTAEHLYFRYFAPLYTGESCLSCHAEQGYHVGDLRGGISILLNIDSYPAARRENMVFLAFSGLLAVGFLSVLIFFALNRSVISPLQKIEQAAREIESGKFDKPLQLVQNDEIGQLAGSFERMRKQIKSYTEALRHSEKKYRSLIENSLEAIAIVDKDGQILECNSNLLRLTGYQGETLKGRPFDILIAEKNYRRSIGISLSPQTDHYETRLYSRDGVQIPVEVYEIKGFSLGEAEDVSFLYVRDLSEQKRLEQLSIQTEKMVALGQLAAGIAHEIRNPLFSLNNNVDYLKKKACENPVMEEIYPELKDSIDRIHRIVSDVLDFSRPHEPEFREVAMANVIESALRLVKKQFEWSQVTIEKEISPNLKAECDPHLIEQVLVNLFLNAFNAMEKKGKLKISACQKDGWVEIMVADTGKGIPPEDLKRIFDPFYSNSAAGTGLGLAIVQRILDQHGARYQVDSQPYMGTTFKIYLPEMQEAAK
ncbi:MAG: hypothetical protein Kow0037_21430 [Calditrichia bacterium]